MKNFPLWIGGLGLLILLALTVLGPYLPFVDPNVTPTPFRTDENDKIYIPPFPPSHENPLGTDVEGRDMLSMIILGAKETLMIVLFITLARYLIAIPLAITASKQSGVMFFILNGWNQLFSGLPTLFAAIFFIHLPFVVSADYRTWWVILILASLEVGRVGYIFQQQAYSLSKSPFVDSGVSIGNSNWGLYRRYYFPYLLPQIIVNFVIDMGRTMLLIGQLGFFAVFMSQVYLLSDRGIILVQNTSLDWTTLLADSRNEIRKNPLVPLFPTLAITFAIISLNLFGEGLRRVFEERFASK
jgi:peptide/nickel transport system permease protein